MPIKKEPKQTLIPSDCDIYIPSPFIFPDPEDDEDNWYYNNVTGEYDIFIPPINYYQ